jgi:hypothetical protein
MRTSRCLACGLYLVNRVGAGKTARMNRQDGPNENEEETG